MSTVPVPPDGLRLLAEQSVEHAFVLADAAARITWWSPGAARMFGYEAAQIVGRELSDLFTPEERASGLAAQEIAVALADDEAEDDRWMQRADGSRLWVTGMLTALRNADGALVGFGKIMRNRTDLQEQFQTLRNQTTALDQSSRRKDAFLSTLSHELRNPLGPLANAVQIIRMTVGTPAEIEQALKVIERQIDALRRLVDDLLDTTRIGAGKLELRLAPITLQALLNEVVDAARPQLQQKRHDLRVMFPEGAMEVIGDRARLNQVFFNLLQNAIKYTPPEGTIWLKMTTEGSEAVIRFEDNGIGIAHDMLPRIFEFFTQAESAQRVAPGGLGIGLALVKELLDLHHGSVQVRSDGVGQGSEFIVRLPLARLHRAD
jgi:two-component system CheB/CheR fusion protein